MPSWTSDIFNRAMQAVEAKKQAEAGEINTYGKLQDFAQNRLSGADKTATGSRKSFTDAIGAVGNFNPMQAMQQNAGFIWQGMNRDFNLAEGQRRAGLNRRGLLGSDIGGAQASNRFQEALARQLAGLSMQGAEMQQRAGTNALDAWTRLYGSDNENRNQFFDAVYGSGLTWKQARDATAHRTGDRNAGIIGAGISAVGNAIPFL